MNRLKTTVILSVIFPSNLPYFDDFLTSLQGQDEKDFDVFMINDGVENLENILDKYKDLNFTIHNFSGTPAENREYGLNTLLGLPYTKIILGDSDDFFSENRVRICNELLDKYDVVINDISTVNSEGVLKTGAYLSSRMFSETTFTSEFLMDKNVAGFSNVSIRNKIFKPVKIDKDIVAVDWFFFHKLLIETGTAAFFTSKAVTFYRQHGNNTIGIGTIDEEKILMAVGVKAKHYRSLSGVSSGFAKLAKSFSDLREKLKTDKFRKEYINYIYSLKIDTPLWWEEAKEY